jgi:hypothetical protein
MDLLAASLRYWVSFKLNTDPGWKNVRYNTADRVFLCTDGPCSYFFSSRLLFPMRQSQEKENTKLWIGFVASGAIQSTMRTRATLSTDW